MFNQLTRIDLPRPGSTTTLVAMIIGFIVFWPVGLAILFWRLGMWPFQRRRGGKGSDRLRLYQPSGNTAFEAYKRDTLERIEQERRDLAEEQRAFEAFAEDLQRARDRAELEEFRATRQGSRATGCA